MSHLPRRRLSPAVGSALRWGLLAASLWPLGAQASLMSPEVEEKIADFMGVAVLVIVPILVIGLFLLVHVLPEKIAAKKHHPQKDAIHTLCLLSLFFGGLLWPLAWLWAYTKPTSYKVAYGTDKHDDYFREHADKVKAGTVTDEKIAQLSAELDHMATKGTLPTDLESVRYELMRLSTARSVAAGASAGG